MGDWRNRISIRIRMMHDASLVGSVRLSDFPTLCQISTGCRCRWNANRRLRASMSDMFLPRRSASNASVTQNERTCLALARRARLRPAGRRIAFRTTEYQPRPRGFAVHVVIGRAPARGHWMIDTMRCGLGKLRYTMAQAKDKGDPPVRQTNSIVPLYYPVTYLGRSTLSPLALIMTFRH